MRLFLGLPILKLCINVLSEFRKTNHALDVRWVPEENMHITVCFLGEVDGKLLPKITEVMRSICAKLPAFELNWDKIVLITRGSGMIWVRLQGTEAWYEFVREVQAKLSPFMAKQPEFRKQIPHVTLARMKSKLSANLDISLVDLPSKPLQIKVCNLYQSELRSEGAKYTILKQFPLK